MLSELINNNYVITITDEMMQKIATALRCKLETVTNGSKWVLYSGESKKDGYICTLTSSNFIVKKYTNGVEPVSTAKPSTIINQSLNGNSLKGFRLCYTNGKNGATFFAFANNNTPSISLSFVISTAELSNGNMIGVYGFISSGYAFWIDGGEEFNIPVDDKYGYSDDFVVLTVIPLPNKNVVINGLYTCLINKYQTERYIFELDEKKYFACDDSCGYGKCVIELDDGMIQ